MPVEAAVTIPVEPTLAAAPLLLHVPPVVPSDNDVVDPGQLLRVPRIGEGVPLIVTVVVL